MDDDAVEGIRRQLKRLRATRLDVGPANEIRVRDMGNGYVRLEGSPRGREFSWDGWDGKASEALERLAALDAGEGVPDAEWTGPEMIRSEFTT
jgi:hypothetical protein